MSGVKRHGRLTADMDFHVNYEDLPHAFEEEEDDPTDRKRFLEALPRKGGIRVLEGWINDGGGTEFLDREIPYTAVADGRLTFRKARYAAP